jgi:hypothetical protein
MVDKVRSNPFSIFIKKIGYSVGLEATLERLKDFANLYGAKATFSYADLKQLMHCPKPSGWDLKNEHIVDVLKSLNILFVRSSDVTILETGEALGILRQLQQDEKSFDKSLRFLFLESLIRADGDIFLNALISSFSPEAFESHISQMLNYKWTILEKHFVTPAKRSAIYQAVTIELQENNSGSKGTIFSNKNKKSPFDIREGINNLTAERPSIIISESYKKKALPRRKAWAISLGLAEEDGSLTEFGQSFVQALANKGFGGQGCMCVWPLKHELSSPEFISTKISEAINPLDTWNYLQIIADASGLYKGKLIEDDDKAISIIQSIYSAYKSLNTSKSIVRSELPGRVALKVGICLASGDGVPDFVKAIEKEQKNKKPRLFSRKSKTAEFALS